MLRRYFLSTVPAAVALVATARQPVSAEENQSPAPSMPRIPEPGPIVVDAAETERAKRLLAAVAQGTFDRSWLAPGLYHFLQPDVLAKGRPFISVLGAPQSMFAFEKCIAADQTSTYFRVRYPKEILTWVVSVDAQDLVTGLSLRRSLNNRIFSIETRDIQY
jgi:hypothetical protein